MTDYYVDEEHEDAFDEDGHDYDFGDEPAEVVVRSRPVDIEGRTSWMYLGLLLALFVLLVFFSWACNDRSSAPGEPTTEEAAQVTSGTSVRLTVLINGDVVTVSGSVPDEAARQQILTAARDQYGSANVVDELQVDETTTLDQGTVSITGSASFDDVRPDGLRQAIISGLGLAEAEFSIDNGEGSVGAVALEGELVDGSLRLAGAVPDEQSIADLIAAGEAVWGAGTIDASGLTVADSTWNDGTIRITGTAGAGDARVESFPAEVQSRLGALVAVDVSGVAVDAVDAGPEALTRLQEEIAAQMLLRPIKFAPLSADIVAESEATLVEVAATLNSVPDAPVEVVGHTDNAGTEADNQVLSLQRAEAVIARLGELGIDTARLTAKGEGESNPLVSNNTADGREQNRRIEFRLVGAG